MARIKLKCKCWPTPAKLGVAERNLDFYFCSCGQEKSGAQIISYIAAIAVFGTQAYLKTCNATRAVKLEENAPEKLYS